MSNSSHRNEEPWRVRLNGANGFPLGEQGVEIQVVNPACFMAQKRLVLKKRAPDKQPKDVLYLHDTLLLFSSAFSELRRTWEKSRTRCMRMCSKNCAPCAPN